MSSALLHLIGDVSELCGTLLIAYAALSVHHRFRHEHKVDEEVFSAMSLELRLGFVGIALIICGFVLNTIVDFILV